MVKIFERLGLSRYEASVFFALVTSGSEPLDYRDILAATEVPYGRVHSTLASLEEKGLTLNSGGRPKKYLAKPIGEIVENYFLTPMMEGLLGSPSSIDSQFRDLWVGQVTSLVPIIHMDDRAGGPSIDFASGIHDVREKEYGETQRAKHFLRLCIPNSAFLDRKRDHALRIPEGVATEILTSVPPKQFVQHLAPEERMDWHRAVARYGKLIRTTYYLLPRVTERMTIVDDRFVSIGTSVLPVTAHIYSKSICDAMIRRFEELKQKAKPVNLAEATQE